jgi:starch-binding outer membrane protein, SusD/RagB family
MRNRFLYVTLFLGIVMASCKKDFTERPALDTPTADNYYNTADQVRGATGTLYGLAWFDYIDKGLDCIGEVRSGNEFTWDGQYSSFKDFTTTATDPRLSEAWNAFYKTAGWANVIIKTLEYKKSKGVTGSFIDAGIAEARFIRGVSYFFIGRIWGDAPIVTDPGALAATGDFRVPKYLQKDVLRFALEDFKAAEAGLPETDVKGRVTRYSAKGMMAKLYLFRNDYDSAKVKAAEVISSGKYDLYNDYAGMFNTSAANNNIESLFALQHVISNEWGSQNSMQAYRAPGNLLITGDGWGSVIPTIDMIKAYEPGDMRRRWSMMEHGNVYPNWKPTRTGNTAYNTFMANGYKYDTAQASPIGVKTSTRASVAKYVVGPGGPGEPVLAQKTQICTYILRYADVLLIYAEASLGANASTSDASALAAYNKVRNRANLPSVTSFTKDDILHERRVEFAFEGDYWFDIIRQGYTKAKQIVEAQERGYLTDQGALTSVHPVFAQNQMLLPIPISETAQNPKLLEAAVAYY